VRPGLLNCTGPPPERPAKTVPIEALPSILSVTNVSALPAPPEFPQRSVSTPVPSYCPAPTRRRGGPSVRSHIPHLCLSALVSSCCLAEHGRRLQRPPPSARIFYRGGVSSPDSPEDAILPCSLRVSVVNERLYYHTRRKEHKLHSRGQDREKEAIAT